MLELKQNPLPRRSVKLHGYADLWRIRVGRYRIIYHIDNQQQIVTILRIALRTESTYRGL